MSVCLPSRSSFAHIGLPSGSRKCGITSSAISVMFLIAIQCGIAPHWPPAPVTTPVPRSSVSFVSSSITVSGEPTIA